MQIRNNIFETNSSSTHAICIASGDLKFDASYEIGDEGYLRVYAEDFGWSWSKYNYVNEKISYLHIYVRDWVHEHSLQIAWFDLLQQVVQDTTKARGYIFLGKEDDGYIDHQAVEDGDFHDLFVSEKTLKSLIFNRSSTIYTGNDNDGKGLDYPTGINFLP